MKQILRLLVTLSLQLKMLQCVFLCQHHKTIFFHFLTLKFAFTIFGLCSLLQKALEVRSSTYRIQGNRVCSLYSSQNKRMSFVCTLLACGTDQRQESIHQHPVHKQRQVCNSYPSRRRKARLLKRMER